MFSCLSCDLSLRKFSCYCFVSFFFVSWKTVQKEAKEQRQKSWIESCCCCLFAFFIILGMRLAPDIEIILIRWLHHFFSAYFFANNHDLILFSFFSFHFLFNSQLMFMFFMHCRKFVQQIMSWINLKTKSKV